MRTEVTVPRRTPEGKAYIVVYKDDRCQEPYLVVENEAPGMAEARKKQAVEQGFGNANSLRAELMLFDDGADSRFFQVAGQPAMERVRNRLWQRDALPEQYGDIPHYRFIAGGPRGYCGDLSPSTRPFPTRQSRGGSDADWMAEIGQNRAGNTIRAMSTIAYTIFEHALQRVLLDLNPFDRLPRGNVDGEIAYRHRSSQELAAIVEHGADWRGHNLLVLCRWGGLRRGEA